MTTIVVTATHHRQPKLPRIPTDPHPVPVKGRHTTIRAITDELYALEYHTTLSDRPLRTEYYPTESDAEHASRRSSTILWRLGAEHLDTIKETAE